MLRASIAQLQILGIERFGVVYPQYGPATPDWSHVPAVGYSLGIRFKPEDYAFRSRHALREYWDDLKAFRLAARDYEQVYCIGADVMDGFYSVEICEFLTGLLEVAAAVGAKATLLGCSFNQQPEADAIAALRRLPRQVRICSRDPVSQQRMEAALGRPVTLVADAAFLLPPSQTTSPLLKWIQQQRKAGRILLGVNTNSTLINTVQHLDPEQFVSHYVATLTQLLADQQNLSFVLVPHDDRFEINDVSLANQVLEQLPEHVKVHCNMLEFPTSPGEVKTVCGELDLVVTSRMHVAIAALGQGIPSLSIGYQGKHEGLYEHFGLPELLISPAEAFAPQGLLHFIQQHLSQRQRLQAQVEAQLPQVQSLARLNFSPKD
jgi:polysaccharide pyruvyl transferase WcaK-like protein